MYLIILTGASGAGKTTIVDYISKKNKNTLPIFFDSIGVPSNEKMIKDFGSGENWQKETTNSWIRTIKAEYADVPLVIFEGQMSVYSIKIRIDKDGYKLVFGEVFEQKPNSKINRVLR